MTGMCLFWLNWDKWGRNDVWLNASSVGIHCKTPIHQSWAVLIRACLKVFKIAKICSFPPPFRLKCNHLETNWSKFSSSWFNLPKWYHKLSTRECNLRKTSYNKFLRKPPLSSPSLTVSGQHPTHTWNMHFAVSMWKRR